MSESQSLCDLNDNSFIMLRQSEFLTQHCKRTWMVVQWHCLTSWSVWQRWCPCEDKITLSVSWMKKNLHNNVKVKNEEWSADHATIHLHSSFMFLTETLTQRTEPNALAFNFADEKLSFGQDHHWEWIVIPACTLLHWTKEAQFDCSESATTTTNLQNKPPKSLFVKAFSNVTF